MALEAVSASDVTIRYFADTCYIGQAYHLEIPLRMDTPEPLDALYKEFLAVHDQVYGHSTESPARIVNLRAVHQSGGFDDIEDPELPNQSMIAKKGERSVLFAESTRPIATGVYDRAALAPLSIVVGPAIIEQSDTTVLIEPGWHARVAAGGNLLISPVKG